MLFCNIDISELADLMDLGPAIKAASDEAGRDLTEMIKEKAKELAGERLHSRRKMFVEGLSIKQDGDVWIVSLSGKVRWIDDGLPEFSMLEALLASPKAKRSKIDGSKYVVVPFDHSPNQAEVEPVQKDVINVIKGEMKRRGIPFSKIETDASGAAKIGKLHSFDIKNLPTKTADGPGMGKGPIGDVRQGASGTPFLERVNVYQSKDSKGKVKRGIMTFRTASSKQDGQKMWRNPGSRGVNILDDATEWAIKTFSDEIAPGILGKVLIDLGK